MILNFNTCNIINWVYFNFLWKQIIWGLKFNIYAKQRWGVLSCIENVLLAIFHQPTETFEFFCKLMFCIQIGYFSENTCSSSIPLRAHFLLRWCKRECKQFRVRNDTTGVGFDLLNKTCLVVSLCKEFSTEYAYFIEGDFWVWINKKLGEMSSL